MAFDENKKKANKMAVGKEEVIRGFAFLVLFFLKIFLLYILDVLNNNGQNGRERRIEKDVYNIRLTLEWTGANILRATAKCFMAGIIYLYGRRCCVRDRHHLTPDAI